LDYEAGISPQTAKSQRELVLIEWGCQGESKDSFVQKEWRKFEDRRQYHEARNWPPVSQSAFENGAPVLCNFGSEPGAM